MNFTRPTANGVYFAPGNTTSSFNGKVIDLTGGGDCGWHQLLNLTLALDDAYMGVPLTGIDFFSFLILSIVELKCNWLFTKFN